MRQVTCTGKRAFSTGRRTWRSRARGPFGLRPEPLRLPPHVRNSKLVCFILVGHSFPRAVSFVKRHRRAQRGGDCAGFRASSVNRPGPSWGGEARARAAPFAVENRRRRTPIVTTRGASERGSNASLR